MANPAIEYEVIGVRPSGRTTRRKRKGAPNEGWMVSWGRNNGCKAVIRYFPSKKGWRVLDIRAAVPVQMRRASGAVINVYRGQMRGRIYFPNEDAAIMAAIHMLD